MFREKPSPKMKRREYLIVFLALFWATGELVQELYHYSFIRGQDNLEMVLQKDNIFFGIEKNSIHKTPVVLCDSITNHLQVTRYLCSWKVTDTW